MKKIDEMKWNVEKVKEKGEKWFEAVAEDFAKRKIIAPVSDAQIRSAYEKLTGHKVEKEPKK